MSGSDVILERLLALHPKSIDLVLDRVTRLLDALGNPERDLPPVLHVAGTNGKGSTVAYLRAVLEASGRTVHSYISPHLVRFHERIVLGGTPIMEDALTAILKECEDANQGLPITFFEITTVAGILAFARHPADALVLEVGLGGRFDATNVIDRPAVTLVTPVSYDHQQYLGDTIEAIAGEKAGILKPGVTGIIGPQTDAARAVIETAAARAGAPLLIQDQDFQAYEEHGRLVYQDGQGLLDLPLPRLAGRHQVANAGTAIAALRATGWDIGEAAYATGMRNAAMPARLQRLTRGPLVAEAEAARGVNAPAADIWLDGGHNPAAGQVLAQALADLEERDPRPLHLIVGMLNTKDPAGFLAPFAGLARGAIAVPIRFSDAGLPPNAVAEAGARAGLATTTAETAGAAFTRILSESGETPPRVLICGSLYLAGEILAEHG